MWASSDYGKTTGIVTYSPFHWVSKDDNNLGVRDQLVKQMRYEECELFLILWQIQ